MSDIKQAAKWIADGKVVRRSAWEYEGKWDKWDGLRKGTRLNSLLGRTGLDLEDLLAEDWEIADE